MKYRFPVEATTLLFSSELLKRCYDGVTQYSVCKGCHRLYRLNENGRSTVTVCRKCDESLIIGGTSNSHLPKMLFEYNSIVSTLKKFMCRPGFVDSLLKRKSRPQQQNLMLDVYDGNVWKQFGSVNGGLPFVQQSDYNIMLTINMDWFQPFVGTQHSSGGIYLTIQNLARDERNLKENVICVGLLPGPKEPSGAEINNYLSPLVDELFVLFDEGVLMDVLVDGALKKERVRAALTMVACDLPAARKLCGFTAGNSNCACHKCLKQFGSLDGDMMRRDFRNFDMASWIPRTNYTHRQAAMEWYQQLNETSKSRHANLHGTKYSELLRLRYFDPVMFTVVDPMHNLYLGTAKKMMMIWRTTIKNRRLMLTNDDMKKMVAEARNIQLPVGYDSSSLIRKVTTGEIGFSHLKADEWKVWVTFMSKVLLLGKLDRQYYQHWLKFVDANILIASPSITTEDVEEAHRLLISFCSEMEGLYGAKNISINMHLHAHLKEGIMNYGPVYGYWVFNFERYNGDIKNFNTNRKGNIESTYLKQFLYSIHSVDYLRELNVSTSSLGYSSLSKLTAKTKKNQKIENLKKNMQPFIQNHLESYNVNVYISLALPNNINLTTGSEALPLSTIASMNLVSITSLIDDMCIHECISTFYQDVYQTNQIYVPGEIIKFKKINLLGQSYKSAACSSPRGSYLCSFFPGPNQSYILRPGQVQFFFCHILEMDNKEVIHTFAFVRWYKPTPHTFNTHRANGLETWSDEFEEISSSCVLPVQRIYRPVGVMKWLEQEKVNVIIPMSRKITG
ncbi:hypothetical protein RO3G_12063 [Rhizopus delemar RA 99-880]|uniref:Transposase domain-containing protein n=2 Tax=Rhizopus TaxID=4842 RepID=I1CFX2_RHIO9|nr:hypothetical protein RO3G_12063 [Rhizopus delemar RA 99-880]|eukprot:EIE87352.1 hypothetical protein RO3G_12063 [Rhizopus delemar RA 99-880]